jgi:DivIVA domain-containing protein
VALDRQTIEKKDFPIGRRGYDPDAVDAHLSALADEIDELRRSSRRRTETLASAASDQVRSIVEAAENSAAEIQRQAEEEAREIRAEAADEAKATRESATGQAREYVGKVSESTAVMLQRLDAMDSELSALIESLRTGSNRLNADLQLLEGNLGEVSDSVSPRPRFEPEPAAAPPPAVTPPPASRGAAPTAISTPAPEPAAAAAPEPPADDDAAAHVADAETEAYEEPSAPAAPEPLAEEEDEEPLEEGEDDVEGARLIALNMALNGTPRDETDRYLAENFNLADRDALLDEVYASVEG